MEKVMTPCEAVEYLHVHVHTIYRLAKNGTIPGRKINGRWKFRKDILDGWLSWREKLIL